MASNQALLLSIRPRFVELIFSGRKTVELRRVKPRVDTGDLVFVYASGSIKGLVGAFEVLGVTAARPSEIWSAHKNGTGLSKEEFDSYYENSDTAYAIRIGKPWRLGTVPLSLLRKRRAGFRPPQSYHYWQLDELLTVGGAAISRRENRSIISLAPKPRLKKESGLSAA